MTPRLSARLRRLRPVVLLAPALVATWLVPTPPARAASLIDAEGVALSESASCEWGDIDVSYTAHGAEAQEKLFTAADGATLGSRAGPAYRSDYAGVEVILTNAAEPQPAGTIVAVYSAIGAPEPSSATTAEFFVLYRCDSVSNDHGGDNVSLFTCYGDYGTCPRTAEEALRRPARPVGAVPTFTG